MKIYPYKDQIFQTAPFERFVFRLSFQGRRGRLIPSAGLLIHEGLSVAVLDQALAKSILAAVRTRSNGRPKAKSRIWATTCGAGEALHAALERCAHGFEPCNYRGVPLPRQGQWAGYQAAPGGIPRIKKSQFVGSAGTKITFYVVEKAQHPNGPNAMFVDFILDATPRGSRRRRGLSRRRR